LGNFQRSNSRALCILLSIWYRSNISFCVSLKH
jgi:hypothetical protein